MQDRKQEQNIIDQLTFLLEAYTTGTLKPSEVAEELEKSAANIRRLNNE